ncbi:uncharacterized protein LOC110461906 isoform X2 [Mizuhopecten yessoensis]|uniref:uncharacterized protein LOC110461906 isoform X2 n=1 Tax=Mizuhopecten yessoensis TaxID=6573 RepID=UPI000B457CB9|nr:uncharacterized protein LOC110461906 isoform X2 [Mizuhopecten yessoensis]
MEFYTISMADKTDSSEKVAQHHTNMVTKLGGLFATNSSQWHSIRSQFETLGHITTADMGHVKCMFDLCKCLKANGIIHYGRYKTLRDVLCTQHVEAGHIIDTYTKLINQENEGRENNDEPQPMFSGRNSADRKRKQGPSGDRDQGDESKPSNEKRIKVDEEDRRYQFRKQMDNTHDARIIDVWTRARHAVGRIRGSLSTGTGIRVGTKYILTAYHVAADITKQNKSDEVDWSKLDSEQVWIEFHFPKNSASHKFYFEPELIAGDQDLDFALLELKPASFEIPKPLAKFRKPDNSQLFALLGHPAKPNSEIMQFDSNIELFDLDADENSNRRGYMMKDDKENSGYEGIRDKRKVLFDCWVQHGASGSPGIVMRNDDEEPICTLMLVRGFPEQAFSENSDIPHDKMIEQGVTMEAIAKKIDSMGKSAKSLKIDIFGEHFP